MVGVNILPLSDKALTACRASGRPGIDWRNGESGRIHSLRRGSCSQTTQAEVEAVLKSMVVVLM